MNNNNEKRNSKAGNANTHQDKETCHDGVGGRLGETPPSPWGGGYQDNCKILNFSDRTEKKRDPRLNELHEMGLQRVWLEVAESIGVDAMLAMWRILSGDPSSIGDDGRILVPIRSYSAYLRYQRNRYIETMTSMGLSPDEIRRRLREQTGEEITNRHILRIQRRG